MMPKMPTITQVSYPEYRIEFPGEDSPYHGLVFTEPIHRKDWLSTLKLVQRRNFTLPSAQEFAAFHTVRGKREFEEGITRTAAVYFKEGQKTHVAFDDIPDPQQNILLKRMEEGNHVYAYKSEPNSFMKNQWRMSRNDKDIGALIARAERDGRICDLGEYSFDDFHHPGYQYLRLSEPEWVKHPLVQAVLGDCAGDFAPLIFGSGHGSLLEAPYTRPLETLDSESVAIYGVAFFYPYSNFQGIDLAAQFWIGRPTRGIKNPKEWTKAL